MLEIIKIIFLIASLLFCLYFSYKLDRKVNSLYYEKLKLEVEKLKKESDKKC